MERKFRGKREATPCRHTEKVEVTTTIAMDGEGKEFKSEAVVAIMMGRNKATTCATGKLSVQSLVQGYEAYLIMMDDMMSVAGLSAPERVSLIGELARLLLDRAEREAGR